MAEIPDVFLVHEAEVQKYLGTGARGDTFAPAVTIACIIDSKRRLVRSLDGKEVVSEATVITKREHLPLCAPRSKIKLGGGRDSVILLAADRSDGDMGAWQHLEIATA